MCNPCLTIALLLGVCEPMSILHDAELCVSWRLKAWVFNEQCVLGAKAKGTGAINYTRSPLPLSPPPLLHLCFSVDFSTAGGSIPWFIKQIKEVRASVCLCGLGPDSWQWMQHGTFMSPDCSSSHPIIARKWPRFCRLLGVLHTRHIDEIVSQAAVRTCSYIN